MAMTLMKLLMSNAFTVLLLGLAKILFDMWEKKQDRGQAKIERVISEMEEQSKEMAAEMATIKHDVESGKQTDLVLLHDRIWQAFRVLSKKKEVSYIDSANIKYLYEEYEGKGGNHKAEEMYRYIQTIPVTPEESEDEL
jgi:hypothetical protein